MESLEVSNVVLQFIEDYVSAGSPTVDAQIIPYCLNPREEEIWSAIVIKGGVYRIHSNVFRDFSIFWALGNDGVVYEVCTDCNVSFPIYVMRANFRLPLDDVDDW